ncbi:MAG: HPF/RaiA family ribosome-associated protein [Gemmatimonadaceae bacterium]
MEIKTHGHHTEITDSLRLKAEDGARKLADHLKRAVNADIWFGEDGVLKTVEIVLHAPKYKNMVAKAEAKYHEPALTDAIAKMDAQIRRLKSAKKRQVHGVELRA